MSAHVSVSSSILFDCVSILDAGLVLAGKGYSRSVIIKVRYLLYKVSHCVSMFTEGDPHRVSES